MERPGEQVSLIIPVFRDADIVLACLTSIVEDPGCHGMDIIVVDDASGDDTPDRIEAAGFPGVRVVRRDSNGGFARACCDGWSRRDANRPIIGVLNADTLCDAGWLKPCLDELDRNEQTGCVVPSILDNNDPSVLDSAGQSYTSFGWGHRRANRLPAEELKEVSEVFGPTGCCLMAKVKVIEACGGLFREDLECYYEDTELSFRLHVGGYRTLHVPESRIRHRISTAYDSIPRRRAYFVSRNSTLLFWTAVPRSLWWSAIPQRAILGILLLVKSMREGCLVPFMRGRLEAWPMILKSTSLRSKSARRLFSKHGFSEIRRVSRSE